VQSDIRLVLGENPYEGTITRYIRSYNQVNGRKIVVIGPKQRSRYMKLVEGV
jgi:glutathionyl-hydroquinone reductase